MNPKIFGRGTWFYIFFILTLDYKNIDFLKRILCEIFACLPCSECSKHSMIYVLETEFLQKKTQLEIFLIVLNLRNKFYLPINPKIFTKKDDIFKNRDKILLSISNCTQLE